RYDRHAALVKHSPTPRPSSQLARYHCAPRYRPNQRWLRRANRDSTLQERLWENLRKSRCLEGFERFDRLRVYPSARPGRPALRSQGASHREERPSNTQNWCSRYRLPETETQDTTSRLRAAIPNALLWL